MRPVVQAECTLKESAAINQILGRRVSVENPKEILTWIKNTFFGDFNIQVWNIA